MRTAHWLMGTAVALGAGLACSSGTENNAGDAEDFRQQIADGLTNNIAGFSNAIQRLVLSVQGQPQNGVTLTPITNGVQGSVGVDVDGDGSLETTVQGQLVYVNPSQGLAGGANFTLTGITGGAPQTASGSALITLSGPASVTITNGTFSTRTDTRGNDVSITNANITADVANGAYQVDGTANFSFNGLHGLLTFEPVGNWFQITVSGPGFGSFTVP